MNTFISLAVHRHIILHCRLCNYKRYSRRINTITANRKQSAPLDEIFCKLLSAIASYLLKQIACEYILPCNRIFSLFFLSHINRRRIDTHQNLMKRAFSILQYSSYSLRHGGSSGCVRLCCFSVSLFLATDHGSLFIFYFKCVSLSFLTVWSLMKTLPHDEGTTTRILASFPFEVWFRLQSVIRTMRPDPSSWASSTSL